MIDELIALVVFLIIIVVGLLVLFIIKDTLSWLLGFGKKKEKPETTKAKEEPSPPEPIIAIFFD